MLNLSYRGDDEKEGLVSTGLALSYSREYEFNSTNRPLLEQVVNLGGGQILGAAANPFTHNLVSTPTVTSIWRFLALLSACLFPIEIFVRRVMIPWGSVYAVLSWPFRIIPVVRRLFPAPQPAAGPATGVYLASGITHRNFEDVTAEEVSFGIVVEPSAAGPADKTNADTPQSKAESGHSDYTQKLFAAKERALKQRRRGGQDKKD
jgi:hypothetical protein